jgi:hypothetical protein
MACDVFEEDPCRIDLADDAGNIRPEVAFVIGSASLSGHTERLAWIACEDGVDRSPEGHSVEGCNIVPYRGRGEVSCALGGNEHVSRELFPFDKASGVESRLGKHEAKIKPTAACAEG